MYLDWTDAEVIALTRERRRERLLTLCMQEPQDAAALSLAYRRVHGVSLPMTREPLRYYGVSVEFARKTITIVWGRSKGRRRSSYKAWRDVQWRRGNRNCYYCRKQTMRGQRSYGHPLQMTVDHKTPLALGGHDESFNWAVCCSACNNAKGSLTEAEFRSVMARLTA